MSAGMDAGKLEIAAVLLLAGGVTPSPLGRAAGRASHQLPVAAGFSILECWERQIGRLAGSGGRSPEMRLLVDAMAAVPVGGRYRVCRDGGEIRGAGGALRDATLDLDEDAWVVAAPASQIMTVGLDRVVGHLAEGHCAGRRCDATLGVNRDGMPGSVLLARVGALWRIQPVGFVDLKEQALPMMAKHGEVRAVRFAQRAALSVRTPVEYLGALRVLAGGDGEGWRAAFAVSEPGAEMGESITMHDSVVLRGATVGSGAVLVRSLVCPGARVRAGEVCVDRVVIPETRGARDVISRRKARVAA